MDSCGHDGWSFTTEAAFFITDGEFSQNLAPSHYISKELLDYIIYRVIYPRAKKVASDGIITYLMTIMEIQLHVPNVALLFIDER